MQPPLSVKTRNHFQNLPLRVPPPLEQCVAQQQALPLAVSVHHRYILTPTLPHHWWWQWPGNHAMPINAHCRHPMRWAIAKLLGDRAAGVMLRRVAPESDWTESCRLLKYVDVHTR